MIQDAENWHEEQEQFEDRLFENLPPVSNVLKTYISSNVTVGVVLSNLDWRVGKPCPECGSEELARLRTTTEQIESTNGNTSLQEASPHVDELVWWCSNCEETLRLHPGLNLSNSPRENEGALLPVAPEDYPRTPAGELFEMLEEMTQSNMDWDSGDPCPECGSTRLIQISADVEYTGESGTAGYSPGDRMGVLRYECDDCRTVLHRHLIEPLVPEVRP